MAPMETAPQLVAVIVEWLKLNGASGSLHLETLSIGLFIRLVTTVSAHNALFLRAKTVLAPLDGN